MIGDVVFVTALYSIFASTIETCEAHESLGLKEKLMLCPTTCVWRAGRDQLWANVAFVCRAQRRRVAT